jgi:hypothetical protein
MTSRRIVELFIARAGAGDGALVVDHVAGIEADQGRNQVVGGIQRIAIERQRIVAAFEGDAWCSFCCRLKSSTVTMSVIPSSTDGKNHSNQVGGIYAS